MTAFPSLTRKAFSGLALAIVKADRTAATAGAQVTVTATAAGLKGGQVVIQSLIVQGLRDCLDKPPGKER
ncbi:hypothetical protein VTK73DRAFT_1398 [Phialemonium thermophilum]|uniref:Uncharacterized protein n=1 Tax=Phialemonium thermophilum TaxID=223376 RepID=A0ABR3VTL7_9PEZI